MNSDLTPEKHLYRVYLKSVPGMYAQYEGPVEVWSDGKDLFLDAVRKLRSTSFPDRHTDQWRMMGSEVIR